MLIARGCRQSSVLHAVSGAQSAPCMFVARKMPLVLLCSYFMLTQIVFLPTELNHGSSGSGACRGGGVCLCARLGGWP